MNLKKIVWGESIFIRGYVDQICVNGVILVLNIIELWPCSTFSLPPKYFDRILIWLSYITYVNLMKIVWGESIFKRGYVDQIWVNGGKLVFVEVELWPCSFLIPTKIFWSKDNMNKLYNICEFKETVWGESIFIRGYVDQICVNGGILVLNIIELWPYNFLTPTKIFW